MSFPAKLETSHRYWPPTLSSLVRFSCCVVGNVSPVLKYLHTNSFPGPPCAVHVNCTGSPSKELLMEGVAKMLPLGDTESRQERVGEKVEERGKAERTSERMVN